MLWVHVRRGGYVYLGVTSIQGGSRPNVKLPEGARRNRITLGSS